MWGGPVSYGTGVFASVLGVCARDVEHGEAKVGDDLHPARVGERPPVHGPLHDEAGVIRGHVGTFLRGWLNAVVHCLFAFNLQDDSTCMIYGCVSGGNTGFPKQLV